jgi:hypothetical protein
MSQRLISVERLAEALGLSPFDLLKRDPEWRSSAD